MFKRKHLLILLAAYLGVAGPSCRDGAKTQSSDTEGKDQLKVENLYGKWKVSDIDFVANADPKQAHKVMQSLNTATMSYYSDSTLLISKMNEYEAYWYVDVADSMLYEGIRDLMKDSSPILKLSDKTLVLYDTGLDITFTFKKIEDYDKGTRPPGKEQ
jgi:hypothetical protein